MDEGWKCVDWTGRDVEFKRRRCFYLSLALCSPIHTLLAMCPGLIYCVTLWVVFVVFWMLLGRYERNGFHYCCWAHGYTFAKMKWEAELAQRQVPMQTKSIDFCAGKSFPRLGNAFSRHIASSEGKAEVDR